MNQQSTGYLLSDWQPLYQGIDYASGSAVNALDVFPTVTRIQHVNVLRIQLSAPGIRFFTTPKGNQFAQTVGQTISGFLTTYPDVRVAINSNYSWFDTDQVGGNFSLFGLAISEWEIVCDPTKPAPQPTPTQDADVPSNEYVGAMALMITADNDVSFAYVTADTPVNTQGIRTAIAGSVNPGPGWPPQYPIFQSPYFLIDAGNITPGASANPAEGTAGRTGVGLSNDGKYLYLLTIDGREHSTPPYGAAFYDLASWLQIASGDVGIQYAINLDGGGSTAMARSDLNSSNEPVVSLINVPYGDEKTPGLERVVGNYFGVCAYPLE